MVYKYGGFELGFNGIFGGFNGIDFFRMDRILVLKINPIES
jgi:hypothetical protein